MPAKSVAQRKLMAIAEHNPSAVYDRDKSVLAMGQGQLHDFAATPQNGLPQQAPSSKKRKFSM